jgi:hypothetical protein
MNEQATEASTIREIILRRVRTDGGTQARVSLDEKTVKDYAEAMEAGAVFPPGVVFYDGRDFWLADGFHRLAAAARAGLASFRFEVRQGTRRDAVLYAVGANARHGLRRTDADKRRAVETLLRDEEWGRWSDHEIARRSGLSKSFIAKMRRRLDPGAGKGPRLARRGGTVYEMKPRREGAAGDGAPNYVRDWLRYLVGFTPAQFVSWQRIVNGRAETAVAAEAVEVVMRELSVE